MSPHAAGPVSISYYTCSFKLPQIPYNCPFLLSSLNYIRWYLLQYCSAHQLHFTTTQHNTTHHTTSKTYANIRQSTPVTADDFLAGMNTWYPAATLSTYRTQLSDISSRRRTRRSWRKMASWRCSQVHAFLHARYYQLRWWIAETSYCFRLSLQQVRSFYLTTFPFTEIFLIFLGEFFFFSLNVMSTAR